MCPLVFVNRLEAVLAISQKTLLQLIIFILRKNMKFEQRYETELNHYNQKWSECILGFNVFVSLLSPFSGNRFCLF